MIPVQSQVYKVSRAVKLERQRVEFWLPVTMANECRASVWENGKDLELDDDDNCLKLWTVHVEVIGTLVLLTTTMKTQNQFVARIIMVAVRQGSHYRPHFRDKPKFRAVKWLALFPRPGTGAGCWASHSGSFLELLLSLWSPAACRRKESCGVLQQHKHCRPLSLWLAVKSCLWHKTVWAELSLSSFCTSAPPVGDEMAEPVTSLQRAYPVQYPCILEPHGAFQSGLWPQIWFTGQV